MVKQPVPDQKHIIYTPKISFYWVDFDISPCVYPLDYTYSLRNTVTGAVTTVPGPTMITMLNADLTFEIESVDPNDVGTYEVIVTGTTPTGTMAVPYSEDLIINLELTNDC